MNNSVQKLLLVVVLVMFIVSSIFCYIFINTIWNNNISDKTETKIIERVDEHIALFDDRVGDLEARVAAIENWK